MNPVVRLIILIALVIGVGGFVVQQYVRRKTDYEAQIDLLRIQKAWDQRAPAAREIASNEDYGDEMRGLLRWYFAQLTDHDNRYPDQRDHEKGWKDIQHKKQVQAIKGPEFDALSVNHDTSLAVYKLLQHGYEPAYSGSSAGQHFDFLKVEKQVHDNKPMLRIDFAWWGPQRREDVHNNQESGQVVKRTVVNATVDSLNFSLYDEKGKLYGEVSGGEPNEKIPDPDRYVDLFPPNVVLGTWWIDLFPHEVQKMDVKLTASTRTVQGHDIVGNFSWSLPVKDEWKLGEGAKWEGATEEEREVDEPAAKDGAKHTAARKARH
jgi:hypothetical protein